MSTSTIDITPIRDTENRSTHRNLVATFPHYADAQRAVDELSDQEFPVKHVQIVARGLNMVEQVTGRLDTWRAFGLGMGRGGALGAMVGLFFALFDLSTLATPIFFIIGYAAVIGAVFGGVLSLLSYAESSACCRTR